jgi:hypothetical protein
MRIRLCAALACAVLSVALLGCDTGADPGSGFTPNNSGYFSADEVFRALEGNGWPVADGYPSSSAFQGLRGRTRCESSRTFVRSDAESGWGFICVGAPADLYASAHDLFAKALVIMGPLYLSSADHTILVFGFGWPGDTSEKFEETLKLGGDYLLPPS